ncbi:MAG: outer membrane protein [Pseudolabrys sp.]
MKSSVIATLASIFLIATPAVAARLPIKATPASPNWTGFYVGGHAGYGWSRIKETSPTLPGVEISTLGHGFLGGGQFGFNWQTGPFVLGAEADISGSTVKGDTSCPLATVDCQHNLTWLATLRARAGALVNDDRTLIYVTGGGAWAHINYKEITRATGALYGTGLSETHSGWALGGGIEQMILPRLSVRLEYLYVGLDRASTPANTLSFNAVNVDSSMQTISVGLNYRFWSPSD